MRLSRRAPFRTTAGHDNRSPAENPCRRSARPRPRTVFPPGFTMRRPEGAGGRRTAGVTRQTRLYNGGFSRDLPIPPDPDEGSRILVVRPDVWLNRGSHAGQPRTSPSDNRLKSKALPGMIRSSERPTGTSRRRFASLRAPLRRRLFDVSFPVVQRHAQPFRQFVDVRPQILGARVSPVDQQKIRWR